MGRPARGLGVIIWLTTAVSAQAQIAPVGVPKGTLRIETEGLFDAFDERFRDGTRESYGADLSSPALGSDRIPALREVDTRLRRITNSTDLLTLGRLSTDAITDISTAVLGLSFGLSNRLTVFGRIPLTNSRTQYTSRYDPADANAGFVLSVDQQTTFFQQFTTALGTLNTKLAAGDYDGSPAIKALAQATLTDGSTLYDDLFALLGAPNPSAPFAPTVSSRAGARVITRVETLQNTLSNDLNVTGFLVAPRLPQETLTADEFTSFLSSSTGLGFRVGQTQLRFRGDAETGVAYTLVDSWTHSPTGDGFRTAVSALVRLPTGIQDRPDRLLDLGSGDGQTDIELGLVSDIANGRWGARLTGTYLRQLPGNVVRRVAAPSQPLAGPDRLALIRWDPGDVIMVGIRPFYRMTRTFGLHASADHWRRGNDEFSYARPADVIAGVDANVMAIDSKASATAIGAGVTYFNPGALIAGGHGLPVEASWAVERVVGSGEGRVPAIQRVRASLRLYVQLFK